MTALEPATASAALQAYPLPPQGLSREDAARRLSQQGPNELKREQSSSSARILVRQVQSPIVWLLIAACIVSGALGEVVDAVAIGTIVLVNALVGFFQEYRAERAVHALRSMTAPRATVIRSGRAEIVAAAEIVVGDLLVLEAGDVVAADAHLTDANQLTTIEASLTGESMPVDKRVAQLDSSTPLAERCDSVFMGTTVANGTGRATVFATGMQTELGKIAHLLSATQETSTPLQERLLRVTQSLLYICIGIVAAVAVAGIAQGRALLEVALGAVSLAVAAVPEGLPAIVTIALAIGVQRMAARHVLVRKLPAVETLGCATVICTDKTGTLTTGVMTVRELWGADHAKLIDCAAACCDAELGADGRTGVGDTTEVAILIEAAQRGIQRTAIEAQRPRVSVTPFDSERKRMSIRRADGVLYVKGAVEVVLARCAGTTAEAVAANAQMAERGLRVLAVAVGDGPEERALTFVGLIGIADPPRTEVIEAIAQARTAGIKTVMITGDHPVTARAIARELGLTRDGEPVHNLVHARATPEDKLRIVREWKDRGDIVAMTGDGVNDAPALREAHIGIAMGITGTEVTREASDMILADDNFASIVAAVREGRGIFENIRKTLVYLLAGNAGELFVMLFAALGGLPFPLLPLHLLWINLVTDGLPALALVMDPTRDGVLNKPARRPDEPMLGRPEWTNVIVTGLLQAFVTIGVFVWALDSRDLVHARNLAFSTLVFGEIFRAFAARSTTQVLWELGPLTNLRLVVVAAISIVVQLTIHHLPAMQGIFQIRTLSLADCALSLLLGLVPVSALELSKLVLRRRSAK